VRLHIYKKGLAHISVCAPNDMTREQIGEEANAQHPTGIESRWEIDSAPTFTGGQPNPCPCEKEQGRMHYLMVC
jgi:hypothetical protein